MSLLLAWLLFPLVLSVLAAGCGLLLRSLSCGRVETSMLLPAGAAVMIVAASLATAWPTSAPLTAPLVVALAVAGFGLALPGRPRRLDPWLAAAALAVFAVYAAPVVLSGQATFAGYIKLDDTSTFLAFTDRAMEHGRSLSGLAPSSYRAALAVNIPYGYPLGAFLPLGIGARFLGVDLAWLFQPCIAFFAALLSLALGSLLDPLVRSRPLRALAAFIAAQAALLFGYALWGGLKELAATFLIASAAVFAPTGVKQLLSLRTLLPFAVTCAALLAVLNVGAVFWLCPLVLPVVAVVVKARERRPALGALGGVVSVAALSLPTLAILYRFSSHSSSDLLMQTERLGNLLRPLTVLQVFGVWPNGDFRIWPDDRLAAEILIAVVALAAATGVVVALKRRLYRLPLLAATVMFAALVLERTSSPWLAGKAYAIASPALVLAALALASIAAERGFRVEGLLLGALIAGGVLWSNVLAYQEVWLAPRAQLTELERIGERFAGQGPALMTEYQPYGVRHFLRGLDAEGASELRVRPVPLADGTTLGKAEFADLDQFQTSGLLIYRTLVLRRSPVSSLPPAPYALVWRGRYYEVWQRGEPPAFEVVDHLGLGDGLHVAAVPSCGDILRLAAIAAKAGGRLLALQRENSVLLPLAATAHPAGWQIGADGQTITPTGSGSLSGTVKVPRAGGYGVWLGGSFARTVTVSIDGRPVGSQSGSLTETGQWTPFGSLRLGAGDHDVSIRYSGSRLSPGSGAGPFALGPLALGPVETNKLLSVSSAGARSLCGRTLDWIEAVD
jgi:hypothetical protein